MAWILWWAIKTMETVTKHKDNIFFSYFCNKYVKNVFLLYHTAGGLLGEVQIALAVGV